MARRYLTPREIAARIRAKLAQERRPTFGRAASRGEMPSRGNAVSLPRPVDQPRDKKRAADWPRTLAITTIPLWL